MPPEGATAILTVSEVEGLPDFVVTFEIEDVDAEDVANAMAAIIKTAMDELDIPGGVMMQAMMSVAQTMQT